jgi:hypothetical protein
MSGTSFFRTSLLAIGMASAGINCAAVSSIGKGADDSVIEVTRTIDCLPGQAVHARAEMQSLVHGNVTVECRPDSRNPVSSFVQSARYPDMAWSDAECLSGARAHASASIRNGNPSAESRCDAIPPSEMAATLINKIGKALSPPSRPSPQGTGRGNDIPSI